MATGFDEERSHSLGVQNTDIVWAAQQIAAGIKLEASHSEQWQFPTTVYGDNDFRWEGRLKANPYVGDFDFGQGEWDKALNAIDVIMTLFLQEMIHNAKIYNGLKIGSYIRQGSSRDGLKVLAPDEFDTVIEFHIDGLQFHEKAVYKHDKIVPGYCYIEVDHSEDILKKRYITLWKQQVFKVTDKKIYICSKTLHATVFMSIFDKSCKNIQDTIDKTKKFHDVNFSVTRKMKQPAISLTFRFNGEDERIIDLDIVPGFRLRNDNTTLYQGQLLNCPIHAVSKWREDEHKKAFDFARSDIWQITTTGYEKHALDDARDIPRQKYIMTALRVVKAFFAKSKKSNTSPPQLCTVIKSYHLKQVAFYVILHLCFMNSNVTINGVCDALRYFLSFLMQFIKRKRLPHFFYSNAKVHKMFPNFPTNPNALRFDLFRDISPESLNQALQSLNEHIYPELGYMFGCPADSDYTTVMEKLNSEIFSDGYF